MPTTTCWTSKPSRRLTWCPLRSSWMWTGTPTLLDISGWCQAGRAAGMSSSSHRWESLPQVYSLTSELKSRLLAKVDVFNCKFNLSGFCQAWTRWWVSRQSMVPVLWIRWFKDCSRNRTKDWEQATPLALLWQTPEPAEVRIHDEIDLLLQSWNRLKGPYCCLLQDLWAFSVSAISCCINANYFVLCV